MDQNIVNILEENLKQDPNNWETRFSIAKHYSDIGSQEDFARVVSALPEDPTSPEQLLFAAQVHALYDPQKALQTLERIPEGSSVFGNAHLHYAELYVAHQQPAEARSHYDYAVSVDPSLSNPTLAASISALEQAAAAPQPGTAAAMAPPANVPVPPAPVTQPMAPPSAAPGQAPAPGTQPMAPGTQPMAPGTQPMAPGTQPMAPGTQPMAPGTQPMAPPAEAAPVPPPAAEIPMMSAAQVPVPQPMIDPAAVPPPQETVHDPNPNYAQTSYTPLVAPPQPVMVEHPQQGHIAVTQDSIPGLYPDPTAEAYLVAEQNHQGERVAPMAAIEGSTAKNTGSKFTALIVAIIVHVVLFILIGLVVWGSLPEDPPTLIVAAQSNDTPTMEPETKQMVNNMVKQKPAAPSAAAAPLISAVSALSPVEISTVDATEDAPVDMGVGMGDGFAMGTFGEEFSGKGSVSFMGHQASASRIVYVVDVSKSMGARKFPLMQEELINSIKKMPEGIQYQIIFFSGATWGHDTIGPSRDGPEAWEKFRRAFKQNRKSGGKLPRVKYLVSSPSVIKKSQEIIETEPMTLGTTWGTPILTALAMRPAPEVIFFMTDGTVGNPEQDILEITEANKNTKIHTTAMMEPKAQADLEKLAKANGGEFTIILSDGKAVKGDDYKPGMDKGGKKKKKKKKR